MKQRAISSVYGRIEELAIAMKGEVNERLVARSFTKMFQAFNDRTRIVVLGKFSEDLRNDPEQAIKAVLKNCYIDDRHGVVLVDACHPQQTGALTDWIEDPFVVLQSTDGNVTLLEPFLFEQTKGHLMAEQFSNGLSTLIRSTRFHLEGGNILVGDDFAVVGKDLLMRNMVAFRSNHKSDQEAELWIGEKFRELLGVNYIIWCGLESPTLNKLGLSIGKEAMQPLFHIDLFVTLGGKSRGPGREGDELVFVAQIDTDGKRVDKYVKGLPRNEQDKRWSYLKTLAKQLDEIKDLFEHYHENNFGPRFHVVRIPIQIEFPPEGEKPLVLSYNNCLVEYYDGIRRAYLPDFEIPEHKGSDCGGCARCFTHNKFQGLGFRITWVEASFHSKAKEHGALNCMTKVLKRSKY